MSFLTNAEKMNNELPVMEHKDNLLGVVETIFRWKKFIIVTCVATAVGAAIVSLLLPVYYKSTTTFYAASPDLAIPEAIFGDAYEAPDYYGLEADIDRIISIANSGQLTNFMIDSFNLYEVYDIDKSSQLGPYNVRLAFDKNFEVEKTRFDAIEISMEDKDKERATKMVNAARERINFLAQKLIKESQAKVITTYESNISQKGAELDSLNATLQGVREKYGVFNTIAQSEGLADLLAKAEAKLYNSQAKLTGLQGTGVPRDSITFLKANIGGYENEIQKLNEKLKIFNQGMAVAEVLKETQTEASEQLAKDRERYKQIKAAYNSEFLATLLLEPATVPLVKSRPKRALIVAACTAIALVFSVIGVLIFDTYRDVNWRQIVRGGQV